MQHQHSSRCWVRLIGHLLHAGPADSVFSIVLNVSKASDKTARPQHTACDSTQDALVVRTQRLPVEGQTFPSNLQSQHMTFTRSDCCHVLRLQDPAVLGATWPSLETKAGPNVCSQLLQWCWQDWSVVILLDKARERAASLLGAESEALPPLLPVPVVALAPDVCVLQHCLV